MVFAGVVFSTKASFFASVNFRLRLLLSKHFDWNECDSCVFMPLLGVIKTEKKTIRCCQGRCLLLLLRIRSAHLEILGFTIGDAY